MQRAGSTICRWALSALLRMTHPALAQIALQLDTLNRKRREIEAEMQDSALIMLETALSTSHSQNSCQNSSLNDSNTHSLSSIRSRLAPRRDRHTRIAHEG